MSNSSIRIMSSKLQRPDDPPQTLSALWFLSFNKCIQLAAFSECLCTDFSKTCRITRIVKVEDTRKDHIHTRPAGSEKLFITKQFFQFLHPNAWRRNWNAAANSPYLDQERDSSVRDKSYSAVILSALCLPSRLDLIDLFSFCCEIFSDSDWSVLFCGRRTVDTICFSSDE